MKVDDILNGTVRNWVFKAPSLWNDWYRGSVLILSLGLAGLKRMKQMIKLKIRFHH